MPASSSAASRIPPAGPTNGSPARSSRSPGCSPTSITRAEVGPDPKTVWVPDRHRAQARQSAAARRSLGKVGRGGVNSPGGLCVPRTGPLAMLVDRDATLETAYPADLPRNECDPSENVVRRASPCPDRGFDAGCRGIRQSTVYGTWFLSVVGFVAVILLIVG